MKKTFFLMSFLLAFWLSSAGGALQKTNEFVPKALIFFDDGSTLELGSFAFYDTKRRDVYLRSPDIFEEIPFLLKEMDSGFFNSVSLGEIKRIIFSKDPSPKSSPSIWNIFRLANVTLKSGKVILGKYPLRAEEIWLPGGPFWLRGKKELLGKTGDFSIDIPNVDEIRLVDDMRKLWEVDASGKTHSVKDLKLGRIIRDRDDAKVTISNKDPLTLYSREEKAEISISLGEIRTLEFLNNKIEAKITTRNGKNIVAELFNARFGSGIAADGRRWYSGIIRSGDDCNVFDPRSIKTITLK
jgi:hypothetical protein